MSGGGPATASPNLFDALAQAAARHGESEFLIVGRRAEVASFAGLARSAERFARLLAKLGVKPGDHRHRSPGAHDLAGGPRRRRAGDTAWAGGHA